MFAFHKYRGAIRVISIRGIDSDSVKNLVCETHEDMERGHITSYRVERIQWPARRSLTKAGR